MKNTFSSIKDKIIQRYTVEDENLKNTKSTNINVLLNRVRQDKRKENQKKILVSAITSFGLILFGIIVF